ncbi:hypothetical protein LSCM1_01460 [Leishmania martiniquensis]|uniref:Uncharacterized protein n=1 Tax=Leishmania martiniquensis TaxID=1580590 RepID=A0A836GAM8_9TRYP|nr:hypothetical protein LSCM1_01460 [Leishmania martiniquensis]
MPMWQASIVDAVGDKEHHNYNAFSWQQLLSNFHLASEADSTEDEVRATLESCPTPTIGPQHSNASGKDMTPSVKLDAHRASSSGDSPFALPEDGYSSEDEHDSPGDQTASGRSTTPFYSLRSTTFTAKSGSGGCAVSRQNSSDATAPCFFVNGVRHSIEDPRRIPGWTGALPSSPSPVKKVPEEPSLWATAPVGHSLTPAKAVVAGSVPSGRSEWAFTTKSTKQSKTAMSPPPYPTPVAPGTGCAVPASPPSSGMPCGVRRPFTLSSGSSAYMANTASAMPPFQASTMPPAQQAMTAPLLWNSNGSAANTLSDAPVLGFVFMDREGRLHLAPQGRTPSASTPSALPVMYVPGGATSPTGTPQAHHAPSTVQAQPWRPAAASSVLLPCPASSELWGTTKAWVFRDSRWISLSI